MMVWVCKMVGKKDIELRLKNPESWEYLPKFDMVHLKSDGFQQTGIS